MSNIEKWKPHPKWPHLYILTDKKTGLSYDGCLIWRKGVTKLLIQLTHESELHHFNSAKQLYDIKLNPDPKISIDKFIEKNLSQTDSYLNELILKRK